MIFLAVDKTFAEPAFPETLPLRTDVLEKFIPFTNDVNPVIGVNGLKDLSAVIAIIESLIKVLITGTLFPNESIILSETCLVFPKPATVSGPIN